MTLTPSLLRGTVSLCLYPVTESKRKLVRSLNHKMKWAPVSEVSGLSCSDLSHVLRLTLKSIDAHWVWD